MNSQEEFRTIFIEMHKGVGLSQIYPNYYNNKIYVTFKGSNFMTFNIGFKDTPLFSNKINKDSYILGDNYLVRYIPNSHNYN